MHHAVEQFGGRGTRDSFPLDGLNRGPWAPVGGRAWQPSARSVAMATHTHTRAFMKLFNFNPSAITFLMTFLQLI